LLKRTKQQAVSGEAGKLAVLPFLLAYRKIRDKSSNGHHQDFDRNTLEFWIRNP
jgi:hypothetical protein